MEINAEIKNNEGLIGKVIKDIHFRNIRYGDYEEAYSAGRIGLYNGIISYNGSTKKSTYYYRCIKNEILRTLQFNNSKKSLFQNNMSSIEYEYDYQTLLEELADDTNIEQELIVKETQEQVRKTLDKLKPNYQKILKLKFGIGCKKLTTKELAKLTGTTETNICDLCKKAKRDFEKVWLNDNRRC